MSSSPTQRSLKYLREEQGFRAAVVEKWIPGANVHRDLFGCIDILGIGGHNVDETIAVQACHVSDVYKRRKKIREDCREALEDMLGCGWRVVVHGWGKDKRGRYRVTILHVTL